MSLQFVLGNAGSGKSTVLYQDLTRQAESHLDRRYFVIVPEQFNMQTQQELVRCSPHGGILNIDILSFPRLARLVFDETGAAPDMVLTETGKNLILRRCASAVKGELKVLGGRLDREGYVTQVKSLLSELEQYNIDDEQLLDMIDAAKSRPVLQRKLMDIRCIRRAFDEFRQDRMITSEEVLKILSEVIPDSELFRDSTIVFDGFTGFTPVQMLVMKQLLRCARSVRIALDMDGSMQLSAKEKKHDLFALTAQTVHNLSRLAADQGVEILAPWILKENHRFAKNEQLRHLEKYLLRYQLRPYRAKAEKVQGEKETQAAADTRGEGASLRIFQFTDPMQEARAAADYIWRLTRYEGYRYRDIAVITPHSSDSSDRLERVFETWQIPCFMDRKQAMGRSSAPVMIRSALRMVEENLSYESVFHFLRCGFTCLSADEIDLCENYVLALGIRGDRLWHEPWHRTSATIDEDMRDRCEASRQHLMAQLQGFLQSAAPGAAQVGEYIRAVRTLCADLQLYEQLKRLGEDGEEEAQACGALRRPGYLRARSRMEYAQMEEVLEQILSEAGQLLGAERTTRREFARILDAGFEEASVGSIPPTLDAVHVGDLERTRLSHIKVLLFLGADDSAIPAREGSGGIISQADRQFLAQQAFILAPDERENSFIQRFYLYQCLTKPSERLWISYAQTDSEGKSLRPAYLIAHLRRIFPDLAVETVREEESVSPRGTLNHLMQRLRSCIEKQEADPGTLEMLRQFAAAPAYADTIRALGGVSHGMYRAAQLSPEAAAAVYADPLRLSVSRMEAYAGCPFGFYARYGLQLEEREQLKIRSSDTGSFMHEVMKTFSEEIRSRHGSDWSAVTDEEAMEVLEGSIRALVEKDTAGRNLFGDTAKNKYMVVRLERALKRSVWAMLRQVQGGKLVPGYFEVPFAEQMEGEGGSIELKGIIDRIDICREEDETLLRVVDYKSGAHRVTLSGIEYGDSLQLTEYLYQAMDMMKHRYPEQTVTPAGIQYVTLQDPVPETTKDALDAKDAGADEAVFLKKAIPNGLLNEDLRVLRLMDTSLDNGVSSRLIPVTLTQKGAVSRAGQGNSKTPKTVSTEKLHLAAEYTDYQIRSFAGEIRTGRIDIRPLRRGSGVDACAYCPYPDVCGFDERIKGCTYRDVRELEEETFWEKAAAALKKENEETGQHRQGSGQILEKE